MNFKEVNPRQSFPEMEKNILKFWKEEKIFQKSLENRRDSEEFEFYDGPPFATWLPHYGHILAWTIKDIVPRYKTMQWFKVERKFWWDCHWLPVENLIEKKLWLANKQELMDFWIWKFNEECRGSVMKYTSEWKETVENMWRWVEFEWWYKTMDTDFMESVWATFKAIWDKKDEDWNSMVYEWNKPMHVCPRCVTPLSNFEVNQWYKDLTDISIVAKFRINNNKCDHKIDFLAWTTTPWTLPWNVALALWTEIEYSFMKKWNHVYVLATDTLPNFEKELEWYELLHTRLWKQLVNAWLEYDPIFDYFKDEKENNWFKLVIWDFVTTDSWTWIVHIAPAFWEDDMKLWKKENLPFIQHVWMDWKFIEKIQEDFWDEPVKDAKDNMKMDRKIVEFLEKQDKVFNKKNLRHSYPTCWRCATPLLNYATKTWFIAVEKMKDKLIANNKKINWTPKHLQEWRFWKWLEWARDWAVSRNRYWWTPLPIWKDEEWKNFECIWNIEELYQLNREFWDITKIIFVRHWRTDFNEKWLMDFQDEAKLNSDWEKQSQEIAKIFWDKTSNKFCKIDKIFSSPLSRCLKTISPLSEKIWIKIEKIEEFSEIKSPDLQWKKFSCKNYKWENWYWWWEKISEKFEKISSKLKKILDENRWKTIVICSHWDPLVLMRKFIKNFDYDNQKYSCWKYLENNPKWDINKMFAIDYTFSNTWKEIDLHKHLMDEIKIKKDWKTLSRVEEVFDCWFESGAMPYAQKHFLHDKEPDFKLPADFIAEWLDQTRWWFYTLHVISTILYDKPAFKNVIVNWIVLAEDWKKMSKSLQNYPDPNLMIDKYWADVIRFYLMNSPVVYWENLRFSEKWLEEVMKSVMLPLWNSYSFFVMYANIDWIKISEINKNNLTNLDKWILSELELAQKEITENMDNYSLSWATKIFSKFFDNITNWYIRRSRKRFWSKAWWQDQNDKETAYNTLHYVLVETSKMLAPFCPFISEEIYKNLTWKSSVHLENWTKTSSEFINEKLSEKIETTQKIIQLWLWLRKKLKIKVRQPLQKIIIAMPEIDIQDQFETIKEELNVKELEFLKDASEIAEVVVLPNAKILWPRFWKKVQEIIKNAKSWNYKKLEDWNTEVCWEILSPEEIAIRYQWKNWKEVNSEWEIIVTLDTEITPELKLEWLARDIIRQVAEMRKEARYNITDRISLEISNKKVKEKFWKIINQETLSSFETISTPDLEWEIEWVKLKIKK